MMPYAREDILHVGMLRCRDIPSMLAEKIKK